MVKVLFTQTRVVQDGTGTTFTAGEVYDLPVPSAERWKRRGVAVDAPPEPVVTQPREVEFVEVDADADYVAWNPSDTVMVEPEPVTITAKMYSSGVDFPKRRGRPPKTRTE